MERCPPCQLWDTPAVTRHSQQTPTVQEARPQRRQAVYASVTHRGFCDCCVLFQVVDGRQVELVVEGSQVCICVSGTSDNLSSV